MMHYIRCLFLLLFISTLAHAQEIKLVKLKPQKIAYIPKEYYIAGVVDDRADTTVIGTLKKGFSGKEIEVNLPGGVANGLSQFVYKNVTRDTTLTPIWLHVNKLTVSEKTINTIQQIDVAVVFSFYLRHDKMVEYSGSGYQRATFDIGGYVGTLIKQTLESSISQFDTWLTENKATVLAPPLVKINTAFTNETDDPELISYDKNKPVTIDDFQGTPDELSFAAAATYSGMNVAYSFQSLGQQVMIDVKLSVYFDKSKSWCKPYARDASTLKHERLHFDITALKACEFMNALKNHTFSIDNYRKELEQLHKQYQKEIDQLQNDYDKETKHGTIAPAQAKWEQQIKESLEKATCY